MPNILTSRHKNYTILRTFDKYERNTKLRVVHLQMKPGDEEETAFNGVNERIYSATPPKIHRVVFTLLFCNNFEANP